MSTKYDPNLDMKKKLGEAHDIFVKLVKIISICGAICGFAYLLAFTNEVGIPFPLDLSVLPVTLLVVGVSSIVGTFIMVGGIFIPSLMADESNKASNGYLDATDRKDDKGRKRLKRYFFCVWIPMSMVLIGAMLLLQVFSSSWNAKATGVIFLVVSAGWVFHTPKYVGIFLEKRIQYFLIISFQIVLAVWAYSWVILIAIAIFPEMATWSAWIACLILFLIFSLLHVLTSVPVTKGGGGKIMLPPNYTQEVSSVLVVAFCLACSFTLASVFMPHVNWKIGRTALRAFHIGGGTPIALCLKTKPAKRIADDLGFGDGECSEMLSLQLDSGDRVYVSKPDNSKNESVKISGLKFFPVYFRQDDIRQKIYFSEKKK